MNKKVYCDICGKPYIIPADLEPYLQNKICSWECCKEWRGY